MYSFLLHSQVIRHTHTSQVSTLLACPGVRLSGNAAAVIIKEGGGEGEEGDSVNCGEIYRRGFK